MENFGTQLFENFNLERCCAHQDLPGLRKLWKHRTTYGIDRIRAVRNWAIGDGHWPRNCEHHWSGSNLSRMQQKCHAADGFRYFFRAKASQLKSSKRQMSPTLESAFELLQLNRLKTKHNERSSWLMNV